MLQGSRRRWDAQQRLDDELDYYRSGGEWVTLSDNERMAAMLAADDDPEGFLDELLREVVALGLGDREVLLVEDTPNEFLDGLGHDLLASAEQVPPLKVVDDALLEPRLDRHVVGGARSRRGLGAGHGARYHLRDSTR